MNYLLLLALLPMAYPTQESLTSHTTPNVIIILTDDQGYQDLGCYGSPDIKTPNLDLLASEGIRFTDFYVCSSVCSPSRAGLLTGRGPAKNGVGGVFFPKNKGMNSSEFTIAELLKQNGYRTACFGKWHLGDEPGHLPLDQGFDEYFGIPYSNDMYIGPTQHFAAEVVFREGYDLEQAKADQVFIEKYLFKRQKIKEQGLRDKCPLFEGNQIIEYPCEQSTLTQRYFDRTIKFIEARDKEPFFVYLTPAMPHVPLFASSTFEGKSEAGLYGDVIEEIDFQVGRLSKYLKEKGLDQNTIIIYTSDNGPWLGMKENAGRAAPLRAGKFTNYEGGLRVPCLMKWSAKWPAGKVSNSIVSSLDLFPTIAHYTKASLPDKALDGQNIAKHLERPNKVEARSSLFIYRKKEIDGIRKGKWKFLPNSGARHIDEASKPELFNLEKDVSESKNLYEQEEEIVKELENALRGGNH